MSAMEQTTVNQYFTARKQTSSQHPSKRRKLDIIPNLTTKTNEIKVVHDKDGGSRKPSRRILFRNDRMKVTNFLAASPLIIENEAVKEGDRDHVRGSLRQEGARTHEKVKANLTRCLQSHFVKECDDVIQSKVNEDVNDQAKGFLPTSSGDVALATVGVNIDQVGPSFCKKSEVSGLLSEHISIVATGKRTSKRNQYARLLKKESSNIASSQSSSVAFTETLSSAKLCEERAHKKYRHLVQKTVPVTFSLPGKYKSIFEMFRCADSVLFLLHQRSETCTFVRLKKSVQAMCGREFKCDHLAAMKTVYPNAFIFRQEKNLHTSGCKTTDYQLTIEANFKGLSSSLSKVNSSVLITRKLKFESNLLAITKMHHQNFLRKLNLKLSDTEIHRWHPNFKIDHVPDIELSFLPRAPLVKSVLSAADLLHENRKDLAPKVTQSLENVAMLQSDASNINKTDFNSKMKVMKFAEKGNRKNKLKGVSSSLLERIRDKEKTNIELAMTRDPKQQEKLSKMERLPEMCRILKAYFTAEKKAAISLQDCVQKLSESYGTALQKDSVEEHIRLLYELLPRWVTIVLVRKCPYVKLTKNYDINNAINVLSKTLKEEQMK